MNHKKQEIGAEIGKSKTKGSFKGKKGELVRSMRGGYANAASMESKGLSDPWDKNSLSTRHKYCVFLVEPQHELGS